MSIDKMNQADFELLKKHFDLEELFNFCNNNRVEVLFADDLQFHCYINYSKGDRAYAIELNSLMAFVMGVKNYKKQKEK